MGSYTAVDLSQLDAPDIVETLSHDDIVTAMIEDLQARDSTFDALVESDPAYKIIEVCAYREVLLRQRVNEACKGVMLAYATGTDLDNLAALFGVTRLITQEATDDTDAVYETDTVFRNRIGLALEGFSTAGPKGAYEALARNADGTVLDASATSPSAGNVLVSVLSSEDDGTASAELLATVETALNDEDARPLCDTVTVESAEIVEYAITATLYFYDGPDASTVLDAAQTAAEAYAEEQHRIGRDVTLSGIHAALHQSGVQRVELTAPTATIVIDDTQASYCTGITLTNGGTDA